MILVNSIVIAMYDQTDRISLTVYNQTLDKIQMGLTAFFTVEAVIRIIGMGLIFHERAYLKDGWNWLDLFSIIVG